MEGGGEEQEANNTVAAFDVEQRRGAPQHVYLCLDCGRVGEESEDRVATIMLHILSLATCSKTWISSLVHSKPNETR